MKKDNLRIPEAEWTVMEVLWNQAPLSAAGIIEALRPVTEWNPKTIHSLIGRLVSKGALAVDKNVSPYAYSPLVLKRDCVKNETKSFVKRFYNDSAYLLVANFIREDNISPEEIEKLKQILDDKLK